MARNPICRIISEHPICAPHPLHADRWTSCQQEGEAGADDAYRMSSVAICDNQWQMALKSFQSRVMPGCKVSLQFLHICSSEKLFSRQTAWSYRVPCRKEESR